MAGDYVTAAHIIPENTTSIFSISKDGYGKITKLNEFNVTGTNTKGIKIQKSDEMIDFLPISIEHELLINSTTTQIKININDVPQLSRGTQGTKLIKLTNNYVIGISSL